MYNPRPSPAEAGRVSQAVLPRKFGKGKAGKKDISLQKREMPDFFHPDLF